jgi:hypothetical protein
VLPKKQFYEKILLFLILILSLAVYKDKTDKVRKNIEKNIKVHCEKKHKNVAVEFDFRKFHVKLIQNDGKFQ